MSPQKRIQNSVLAKLETILMSPKWGLDISNVYMPFEMISRA